MDVLHLADFHLAPGQRKKQRFVQSLAELRPDLIVATGDNLGHKDALPHLAEMLEPFRGIPALSVFGSNDYFGPIFKNPLTYLMPRRPQPKRVRDLDERALRELLFDDLGWVDLTNRAEIVEAGGLRIRTVGVDDPHIKVDRLPQALESLRGVSAGAEWDLTLGLVHAPYQRILTPYVAEVGADAIFAGHTHGGQVCLPGGRAIVSNCDLPTEKAGGLSTWEAASGSAPLHVSRGLGTSIYSPVRLFCPPEATLLRLVPKAR
ncbi:metallophosphoesterase [Gulosibacter molinativorax]|uniref:metallophosphoesterase n=1 Tax=Gulosibacter molinativorax TaxID=256821 RepID=UPI000419B438|nr:metallophosphoesterase [Gulosibacter molinativorax]QUY63530.1 Metallophosphoesterase [Gulosibacter molinativorax]